MVENHMTQEHRGSLCVVSGSEDLSRELRALVKHSGLQVRSWTVDISREKERVVMQCELRWRAPRREHGEPAVIDILRKRPDVERLRWQA